MQLIWYIVNGLYDIIHAFLPLPIYNTFTFDWGKKWMLREILYKSTLEALSETIDVIY